MPSLRRTMSSPSVRSSPYPPFLTSSSSGLGIRAVHRRSSGSETSSRRVLADIEWWKVTDGQCDPDDSEDSNRESSLGRGVDLEELLGSVGLGVDHPTIDTLVLGAQEASQALPTREFEALSISPQTPPRARYMRELSDSSVDSSPELVQPATFGGLRLSIRREAAVPDFPTLKCAVGPPLFSLCTQSLGDFLPFGNSAMKDFADFTVSPLSASPDLSD